MIFIKTYKNSRSILKSMTLASMVFCFIWLAGCKPDGGGGNVDWAVYKADANSSSYSPLDQINSSNVGQLQQAWTIYGGRPARQCSTFQ